MNIPVYIFIISLIVSAVSLYGRYLRQKRNDRGLCGQCSCLLHADQVKVIRRHRVFTFCPSCGNRIKTIDRIFYIIGSLIIVAIGAVIFVFQ